MSRSNNDPGGKDAVIFNSSIDFIEQHKDRPFYLNIWGHVAHSPVEPHPDLVREFCDVTVDRNDFGYWTQEKFADVDMLGGNVDDGMRHYLADLWGLDLQIGLLMDKLRELDLDKKTIIVFTSDHGAAPVDERCAKSSFTYDGSYGRPSRSQTYILRGRNPSTVHCEISWPRTGGKSQSFVDNFRF